MIYAKQINRQSFEKSCYHLVREGTDQVIVIGGTMATVNSENAPPSYGASWLNGVQSKSILKGWCSL